MVLVSLSVVVGASYYIMGLNKNSKQQSAAAKNTTLAELEKRRISALMSDSETCKLVANFGGGSATKGLASLTHKNGSVIAAVGQQYQENTLRLNSIVSRIRPHFPPGDPNPFIGTAKQYELLLTYGEATTGRSAYVGKKNTIIRIPMYFNDPATVSECYAMTENTDIDLVVNHTCSPVTAATLKNSNINATNACEHNVTFSSGTFSDCPKSATISTAFNGFDQNSGNSTVSYLTSRCTGMSGSAAATTCPPRQTAHGVSSSNIQCAYVGGSRDPTTCADGQVIYHTSGTTTSCVTVNCANPFEFVQRLTSASTICFKAPTTSCPAGQYVYEFSPSTGDKCKILPALSGSCTGSDFGTSITRATATVNGTLNCTYYNKAKPCSPNNATTFMNSVSATGAANCTTY